MVVRLLCGDQCVTSRRAPYVTLLGGRALNERKLAFRKLTTGVNRLRLHGCVPTVDEIVERGGELDTPEACRDVTGYCDGAATARCTGEPLVC